MGSPLLDVREFDRFLRNEIHDLRRPVVTPLTEDELELISERFGALAPRVAQLTSIDLHEQNADARELHDASYGYALQHKSRERVLKLIDGLTVAGGRDGVKASSDDELLQLLEQVGLPVRPGALALPSA